MRSPMAWLLEKIARRSLAAATWGPYRTELRQDLRTPMRDGVKLLGELTLPVDAPKLPTILIRGPYGRGGLIGSQSLALASHGFPVFFQSCRGTWGSQGTFTPQINEQADGIDTLRWIRQQPWFTGKVVTSGASYMGFTQWSVAGKLQREEPALGPDGLCLFTTMPDFGEITWDHGAFALRNALGWTRMMDRMDRGGLALLGLMFPDPKLQRAFDVLPLREGDTAAIGHAIPWYQDWVRHEDLSDPFWTQQSFTEDVASVKAPTLMVTGWYDIFLPWQLRDAARMTKEGNQPELIIGPWGHVSPEMAAPTLDATVSFIKRNFVDDTKRAPMARVFITGEEKWHELPVWPPSNVSEQTWHLGLRGTLSRDAAITGAPTSYVYDPSNPTPAIGGPSLEMKAVAGPVDDAPLEQRSDVISFTTEPLSAPLDVTGALTAHLSVRCDAPSFDLFVRVCDVNDNGISMSVCDGIQRFTNLAGVQRVEVTTWPMGHRFLTGHRLRVTISSGAHPRYARNPGTGEPGFTAKATRLARIEIFHDETHRSEVRLPIWKR